MTKADWLTISVIQSLIGVSVYLRSSVAAIGVVGVLAIHYAREYFQREQANVDLEKLKNTLAAIKDRQDRQAERIDDHAKDLQAMAARANEMFGAE